MDSYDFLYYGALSLSSAAIALGGLGCVSHIFSEKISTQMDLERVLSEEISSYASRKPKAKVRASFSCPKDKNFPGCSHKLGDDDYVISARSRACVRHELAHIFRGHLDKGDSKDKKGISKILGYVSYCFIYEPSATLSQAKIGN